MSDFLSERDRRKAIHLLRMMGDHERASAGEVRNAVSQLEKILKPYGFSFDKLIENPEILLGQGGGANDAETNALRDMLRQRTAQNNLLTDENSELRRENASLRQENNILREELQKLLREIHTKAEQQRIEDEAAARHPLKKVWDSLDLESGKVGKVLNVGLHVTLGPVGRFIKNVRHPVSYGDDEANGALYGVSIVACAAFWAAAYGGNYYLEQRAIDKKAQAQMDEAKSIVSSDLKKCEEDYSKTELVQRDWDRSGGKYKGYGRWKVCNPEALTEISSSFTRMSEPLYLARATFVPHDQRNCTEYYYTVVTKDQHYEIKTSGQFQHHSVVCK